MMNAVLSPGRGKRNSSGRTLIMCTGEVTMMGIRLLGVHFSFRSIGVMFGRRLCCFGANEQMNLHQRRPLCLCYCVFLACFL